MTTKKPYTKEFTIEAVKQITERGHGVTDVSARLGSASAAGTRGTLREHHPIR